MRFNNYRGNDKGKKGDIFKKDGSSLKKAGSAENRISIYRSSVWSERNKEEILERFKFVLNSRNEKKQVKQY